VDSVIKGEGYILAHTPDLVLYGGSTQATERIVNPDSNYLKLLRDHLRTFDKTVAYWPHQVYIGNKTPEELAEEPLPWFTKACPQAKRYGKFGQIMPQEEFLLLLQACDAFDLVYLDKNFVVKYRSCLAANPLVDDSIMARVKEGAEMAQIAKLLADKEADGIYNNNVLVGCIKRAHDIDPNLSAAVMLENLASKASSVLAALATIKNADIKKEEIKYVIDCSEIACGDMNQRGGGNLAKAVAEIAGLSSATGSDCRSFCAGPAHAIIEAAALVSAGVYKTILVCAGGCTAKLGMNGKEHIKNNMPILEDVLAGFGVIVIRDDGINPTINLNILGRHTVGTGSAPQAVISSLVTAPLDRAGLKMIDIDKFSPEMQNPEITKGAGAGDVPLANYKMIAALAVKHGDIKKADMASFIAKHGLIGWAPTQGHIPSGVPYLGFAHQELLTGRLKKIMVIGKGSLFLGRMTNLFDGVSFVVQANVGTEKEKSTDKESLSVAPKTKIALTGIGSEHGEANVMAAAISAARQGLEVYYLGTLRAPEVTTISVDNIEDSQKKMEEMLKRQEVDGAVTMHYPFPIGVSTVGKVVVPANGRHMYIATTTGTSSTNRVEAMVNNAIYGIIVAKVAGLREPTVGILNVEGAHQAEIILNKLKATGYPLHWAQSSRAGGGAILRGNDVLAGNTDVLVCDSLTGNILIKMLSAFTTGGNYETIGAGYGPGIGRNYTNLIHIISRASGAPLITKALFYAAEMVKGKIFEVAKTEFAAVDAAGLADLLFTMQEDKQKAVIAEDKLVTPCAEPCTFSIQGIEVMDLDEAVHILWRAGIYAQTGMGCTGPVVMINETKKEKTLALLRKACLLN